MAVAGKGTLHEGTTPTTNPSTGQWHYYFKSDGLYIMDDAGTETAIVDAGDGIVGSVGATDNAVPRANGTGASTVQSSGVIIDDSDNVTGVNDLTIDNDLTVTGEVSASEDTTPDQDADFIIVNDTSAGAVKTVRLYRAYPYAVIQQVETDGTSGGGASAATWNTRGINTELVDANSIVTISSDQFTPIAGVYLVYAEAVGYQVNGQALRIYNATGTAVVKQGFATVASSGDSSTVTCAVWSSFTANGTDAYELQHYTASAKATNGLGVAIGGTTEEIFATVELYKIG